MTEFSFSGEPIKTINSVEETVVMRTEPLFKFFSSLTSVIQS